MVGLYVWNRSRQDLVEDDWLGRALVLEGMGQRSGLG